MKTYSVRELRTNLSAALKELPVLIANRGKVFAVIRETEVSEEKFVIPEAPKTKPYGVKPVVGIPCQEVLVNGKSCPREGKFTIMDGGTEKRLCPVCYNRIKAFGDEDSIQEIRG